MARALLPFYCFPTPPAAKIVGSDVSTVAVLALKAILRGGRGLEIAHQQIRYGEHALAFSSRVTPGGDLIVEIDVGDPKLCDRVVVEADLAAANRRVKGIRDEVRRRPHR